MARRDYTPGQDSRGNPVPQDDEAVVTPLPDDAVALRDVTDQPGYERPDGA